MFHSYSASNCMVLALACHRRGIAPEPVAGFRTWLKLGRCVRRGEVSIKILAPVTVKHRDQPATISAGSDGEQQQTGCSSRRRRCSTGYLVFGRETS